MLIKTRNFYFRSNRDVLRCDQWWARSILIGLFERPDAKPHDVPYRFAVWIDFWLIPNFVWHQDFLYIEHGRPVYQTRIIGIQNWPFYLAVFRHNRV